MHRSVEIGKVLFLLAISVCLPILFVSTGWMKRRRRGCGEPVACLEGHRRRRGSVLRIVCSALLLSLLFACLKNFLNGWAGGSGGSHGNSGGGHKNIFVKGAVSAGQTLE